MARNFSAPGIGITLAAGEKGTPCVGRTQTRSNTVLYIAAQVAQKSDECHIPSAVLGVRFASTPAVIARNEKGEGDVV